MSAEGLIPDPSDKSLLGLLLLGAAENAWFRYTPPEIHASFVRGFKQDPAKLTREEREEQQRWNAIMETLRGPYKNLKRLRERRADEWAKSVLAAEKQQERKTTLVFDGEERLEPIEWLVEELLPAEGLGMLFGESDVGKTFLAVDWGVHIAAERPWTGRAAKGGTVLFVESEGGRAFALRKHAAKGAAGLGDAAAQGDPLQGRLPFVTVYQPLAFGPDTEIAEAVSYAVSVRAQVEARDLPPVRFVVVDTLAQNMSGDADSNAEMQAFLRAVRAFLKALSDEPVFGLLLHHPGHAQKQRARGAYALPADLDVIMHLDGEPESLVLSCKRMRDERPFASVPLRLERRVVTMDGEPLRDARGREVCSLVVVPRSVEAESRTPARDEVKAAVLEALPPHPDKEGVEAAIVPKVAAILGRPVDTKTVRTKCFELEREGLAERGPGRQKDSLRWGKAKTRPEAEL